MPRAKGASELDRAMEVANLASSFLDLAQQAKQMGEKLMANAALKRARNLLNRRLIEEDDRTDV